MLYLITVLLHPFFPLSCRIVLEICAALSYRHEMMEKLLTVNSGSCGIRCRFMYNCIIIPYFSLRLISGLIMI